MRVGIVVLAGVLFSINGPGLFGVHIITDSLEVEGADLYLGTNDGRSVGSKPLQRALVHYGSDQLYVNFDGDFEGGVVIEGIAKFTDGSVILGAAPVISDFWGGNDKLALPSRSFIGDQGSYGTTWSWNTYRRNDNTWPLIDADIAGWISSSFILQDVNGIKLATSDQNSNSLPFIRSQIYPNGETKFYGKVGIGTSSFDEFLNVGGKIRAEEVIVETGWADFVFEENYELMPLGEVGAYIETNRRLPGVPSTEEVQNTGASLGETQALLLQKIEELTLYTLQQQKEIESLKHELTALKEQ